MAVTAMSAGTCSCLARFTSFPFEIIRSELSGTHQTGSTYSMMKHIIQKHGIRGLYKGCMETLAQQMLSSGVRIGGYEALKYKTIEYASDNPEGFNIMARLSAGIGAGGTATFAKINGHKNDPPIKIRTNIGDAIQQYRDYLKQTSSAITIKHHIDVIKTITKQSLSKILQNGFITVAEVASYDIIKDFLIQTVKLRDSMPVHITSAILCGFTSVLVTGPYYSVRQQYSDSPMGTYRNMLGCSIDMYRNGGVRAFYPGFATNLIRLLVFNITLWTSFEQLKRLHTSLKEHNSN